MPKITSSKMDGQKLARLVKDANPKSSANAGVVAEMKAKAEGLVSTPAEILSQSHPENSEKLKGFIAENLSKLNFLA